MAQLIRPTSDVSVGGWTPTPVSAEIDEVTADDATTQASTAANPVNDAFEVHLGNPTDPGVSTGHIVRYRIRKSSSGGRQVDWTVTLKQGATQIAQWTHVNLDDASYTTFTQTLSGTEADSITDYTDLRLNVSANNVGTGLGRSARTTWVEGEVPTAVTTVSLGLVTETDTAQSFAMTKTVPIGLAAETDTAQPMVITKTVPLGLATETDTAQSFSLAKTVRLGLPTETDTALPLSVVRTIPLGLTSETDTALPMTLTKTIALGLAQETDQALPFVVEVEAPESDVPRLPLALAGQ